jgi:hypothetical protein
LVNQLFIDLRADITKMPGDQASSHLFPQSFQKQIPNQ